MKRYLLIISTLLPLYFIAQAQQEASIKGSVKGTIKDTAAGFPLGGATITVLVAKDSAMISFTRSNNNGYFNIPNLTNGAYRLLVTHVGYINISRPFVLSAALTDIDFGELIINNKSTLLQGVTITQEKPPVVIRNDTLEYNAGSFKTKPNAVVEDLLKKLPGIQVDKDGKVKSNGQEVKRVLVDGKEFFGQRSQNGHQKFTRRRH